MPIDTTPAAPRVPNALRRGAAVAPITLAPHLRLVSPPVAPAAPVARATTAMPAAPGAPGAPGSTGTPATPVSTSSTRAQALPGLAPSLQMSLATWMHERMQQALVLADAEGNVFSANAAAAALDVEVDALAIRNGRLDIAAAGAADLLAALRGACDQGTSRLVRLNPGEPEPRYVAVSPLNPAGGPRLAVCVIGPRKPCNALTLQWFAQCHALTEAELVVLQELCTGATPQQIAEQRGVELSTVRTQIACIRDKAEQHTIRDLVRVVSQLPAVRPVVAGTAGPARMAPRVATRVVTRVAAPLAARVPLRAEPQAQRFSI